MSPKLYDLPLWGDPGLMLVHDAPWGLQALSAGRAALLKRWNHREFSLTASDADAKGKCLILRRFEIIEARTHSDFWFDTLETVPSMRSALSA